MHAFIDKYSVAATALLLGKKRWFKDSVVSPSYEEQLDGICLTLPELTGEGFYELYAQTRVGPLDTAFHIAKWISPQHPTIIYHHGNNESPFDYGVFAKNTFKNVLYAQKQHIDANLISLRAPYHNISLLAYFEKMGVLANFTAMLCVSAKLIEALTAHLHERGCKRVMLTGLSLGGWVANLHRCFFSSADVYVPVFAGAALEDLFISSSYSKISGETVRQNPDALKTVLNFEERFTGSNLDNVYPLLARYDQLIRFEVQKRCYPENRIKTIDKGHITGALASADIRAHILAHL